MQFKPVLFKGHLYVDIYTYTHIYIFKDCFLGDSTIILLIQNFYFTYWWYCSSSPFTEVQDNFFCFKSFHKF